MATTFWLSDVPTAASVSSYTDETLATSEQAGTVRSIGGTTTAGGNHLEVDQGNPRIWLYQVNAVTIEGSISFKIWGLENNMSDNCQPAVRVVRLTGTTSLTIASDVVGNANAGHAAGSEWGTSLASKTWAATPTSTAFSDGDWIGVIVHYDAIGTMAAGSTSTKCRYNTSAAGSGDSQLTFTETIVAYTPPADDTGGIIGGGFFG